MPGVAAVILAAGGSSRLGRPKQLVEAGGRTLIRRAVDVAVAKGCTPIVVVVGRDAAPCRAALAGTPAVVVENADWQTGMGSSVRAGFATLPGDTTASFLLLCDQPRVTVDTLNALAMAIGDRTVAAASFDDTIGPPLLVQGIAVDRLRMWPHAEGAKRLWLDRSQDVVHVPCPAAAFDIDTDADVRNLIGPQDAA